MRTSRFASALSQAFDEFVYRRQYSQDDEAEAIAAIGRWCEYEAHERYAEKSIDKLVDGMPMDKEDILRIDESYREMKDIAAEAEYRHGFMDALHLVRFFIEEDDARSASLFCPADGGARQRGYNNFRGGKYND